MAIRVSNITCQVLYVSGIPRSISNSLVINDSVIVLNSQGERKIVEDDLNLQQEVFVNSNPNVESVLNLQQVVAVTSLTKALTHRLGLHVYVGYCFGAPWTPMVVEDVLAFTQKAGLSNGVAITDTISFTDAATTLASLEGDEQFIDFLQSVDVGFGHNLISQLALSQAIQSFSDYLRAVSHENIVQQSMTYYIDNSCNMKQYARFVGDGGADTIPTEGLIFDSDFVLESISDGTLLVLRSPETDDGDRLGFNRINRETSGGELNVYNDPVWAEVETLIFTITALPDGDGSCPDSLGALLQFLQDNLGEEIFLHDWMGISWRGIITTPDEAAVEDSDGYWTVTFEFQGTAEDGSVPNSVMSITQTLDMLADWARPVSHTLAFEQSVNVAGDINLTVTQPLNLIDHVSGVQDIDIMYDDHTAGATSVSLNGQAPDIGTHTWRANTEYLDDGSLNTPVDAGAYYRFTPEEDTVYELTFLSANVTSFSDGDNCIWGFFEDQSISSASIGPTADGSLNPTAARAVHLIRDIDPSTRQNAYRLGSDSDGTADTHQWSDATLRTSASAELDLRILLDTTGGHWTATWQAKETASGSYTEVGPETNLLSENVGAVGWSMDSANTDCTLGSITLKELRPIS